VIGFGPVDAMLAAVFTVAAPALLFEVTVRWLRSGLHRHGAVDGD
jgi:hypothetical protein